MLYRFVGIVVLFLINCCYAEENKKIIVRSIAVEEHELFEKVNIAGACQNSISRDYYANVAGLVDFVSVKQGSIVTKDELIIAVDQELAQTALVKQQANYDLAKNAHERDRKLFAQKLVSHSTLEGSRAKFADAKHQLSQASKIYNDMMITAPFDGEIGVIKVDIGDQVKIGDYLFTIIAKTAQDIIVELPESLHKAVYNVGQVAISDFSGQTAQGQVAAISPLLSKNGTVQVKLSVNDKEVTFTHGSYVNVEFIINRHKGLAVPEQTVMRNEQGSFVYKIIDNQAVKQLYVTLGTRTNGLIEVSADDLKVGDSIVLEGFTKIQDGSKVQLLDS